MSKELVKIKKYYGEEMMHLCRELFPTILEDEGVLLRILEATFPHSKFLYDDIVNDNQITTFKDFIYDKYHNPVDLKKVIEDIKSPFELMARAGYKLYECQTEADIQRFRKYYAKGEELCTFAGGRLDTSIVFFAVKENVQEIKRENFPNPDRQDEYGTSVISIQYRRGAKNTLSVKNRYNHAVDNPDATFGNNLDNIIPGLNDSFERYYNLSFTGGHEVFELSKYVRIADGKYYKYNYEINGIYYGPDNIIIDNYEVVEKYLEKEKYIVMDYYIIDLVRKSIYAYDDSDKYIEGLNNIQKINVLNEENGKKKIVLIMNTGETVTFVVNKFNKIVKIDDEYTTEVADYALMRLNNIRELSMPKVVRCGDKLLFGNGSLINIEMPEVTHIGDSFLRTNVNMFSISFPKLTKLGDSFMRMGDNLKNIDLPNLRVIGDGFMDLNRNLDKLVLPKVEIIGNCFLSSNNRISVMECPNLERVGDHFLDNNSVMEQINYPSLLSVGNSFMFHSMAKVVNLPRLLEIGNCFMKQNCMIDSITLPSVIKVGNSFMSGNRIINHLDMPKLIIVGDDFMKDNEGLTNVEFPNLMLCGGSFMKYGSYIERIIIPKLECAGEGFLLYNTIARIELKEYMQEVETSEGKKLVRKR